MSEEMPSILQIHFIVFVVCGASFSAAGSVESVLLNPNGNSIISPLSIHSTLVPLLLGSDGVTKEELTEFLRSEFDSFDGGYGTLSPLSQPLQLQGQQINSVTALFTSLPLQRYFVKATTSGSFKSKVHLYENFNFSRNFGDINALVSSATNGLISNIVQDGSLNDDTRLVVVNAVHFKAKWRQPFESIPVPQSFYMRKDHATQIPMMTQRSTNHYAVVPELQSKIVEIPYENGDFVMRVILPDDIDGLPKVLELIKTFDLAKIRLKLTEVDIILPKFRISNELDLDKILKNNGLSTLFSPSAANLSKLAVQGRFSNEDNLFVDKLISKAIVEVSPVGTEAGSATAAFIVPLSGLQTFNDFVADHPFMFQIISTKDKSTIFSGTFVQPPPLPNPPIAETIESADQSLALSSTSKSVTRNSTRTTTPIPPLSQQLTFYQLNKVSSTNSSTNDTESLNQTSSTPPWWLHTGKPVYLLPPAAQSEKQPTVPSPSELHTATSPQTHPRFQQPEPTHPTGIRFPFPLTDPTTLFVIQTHHRNSTSTNSI